MVSSTLAGGGRTGVRLLQWAAEVPMRTALQQAHRCGSTGIANVIHSLYWPEMRMPGQPPCFFAAAGAAGGPVDNGPTNSSCRLCDAPAVGSKSMW